MSKQEETVELLRIHSTSTSGGVNTLVAETIPPKDLPEEHHFHPERQTFKIKKGEPNYKKFEDEEIIEVVYRKKGSK